jgi:hypothetical protein
VLTYRLFNEDLPAGSCRSAERDGASGRVVDFDAIVGTETSPTAIAGTVVLGDDLRWETLDLESGGRRIQLERRDDCELEVEGVPSLFGITTRRLAADGVRPSGRRDVQVLHVGADLVERRFPARYSWVTGRSWRYDARRTERWLAVHPGDGLVRSVEGLAELVP